MAQMRRPTHTWSLVLEVDGVPIAYDATLRHYRRGHTGLVAEALKQPLLLPKDMEAYRTINHPELFISLKRDLAMVSDSIHYSSFIHLYFLAFYSKSEIPLVLFFFFFFLGHTASFCGREMGKECLWRDQGCFGCSRQSGDRARCPEGKTR